jgi:hypothetical protein
VPVSTGVPQNECNHHGSTVAELPTLLPNSGTSIDWVRLGNGHSVVVFHNDPANRFPLSAALSYDEGKTFTAIRDLDASCDRASCSYAYPSVVQSEKDGTIWVRRAREAGARLGNASPCDPPRPWNRPGRLAM